MRESWHQTNWPLIDAADKEYQAYIKDQQLKFGKETGMLPALRFVMELQDESDKAIFEMTKHKIYREDRCKRAIKEYEDSEKQLSDNAVTYSHLNYIRNYYGDKINKLRKVPVFNTSYTAQKDAGGNLMYKAEKLAEKQTCDDFDLFRLKQQGPKEVYGMYCEDGTNHLIKCQWGKCVISQD